MGGLNKEGHELLRLFRKKNLTKTQHLIDVLSTQHARWVAKRIRRALFGQTVFSHFTQEDTQSTSRPSRQVATNAGQMRRLTEAFSHAQQISTNSAVNHSIQSPTCSDSSSNSDTQSVEAD